MARREAGRRDLFTVDLHGDSVLRVVRVEGELDLSTAPLLVDAFHRAMAEGPEVLLVELQDLAFMDSTGLRALLEAQEACRAIGCRFLLMRGSRPVERLLEISGLGGFFEFVSDPLEYASSE